MKVCLILIFLLSLKIACFGQNTVLDCYCEFKTKYDTITSIKKLKSKYKWAQPNAKVADLAFAIANKYRLQKDTLYKNWYLLSLDFAKKNYSFERKSERKTKDLYIAAMAYYYNNMYEEAKAYFLKTITCRPPSDCAYYYLGILYKQGKEYKEAIKMFEKFRLETNKNVDDLLKACEQK